MKNKIKRIWCQCCDENNENCDIRVHFNIEDEEFELEYILHFDSNLNVVHTESGHFDVDYVLSLDDINFFMDNYSDDFYGPTFLGSCSNIEDETNVNIEFEDGKIFEDDIVNALRYLISTNTETESN